jgi:hypothetical protein
MSSVREPRFTLYGLNPLWAVPLAFAIGYFPAALVRFERCGLTECLGAAVSYASPHARSAVGVAILGAMAMFGAFALVPWMRPAWMRLVSAIVIAFLTLRFFIWAILFH